MTNYKLQTTLFICEAKYIRIYVNNKGSRCLLVPSTDMSNIGECDSVLELFDAIVEWNKIAAPENGNKVISLYDDEDTIMKLSYIDAMSLFARIKAENLILDLIDGGIKISDGKKTFVVKYKMSMTGAVINSIELIS